MRLTRPICIEIARVMRVGAVNVFMLSSCGDDVVAAVGPITHWLYLAWKNPDDGVNDLVVVVGEAYSRLAAR